jgi:hypothetical protein
MPCHFGHHFFCATGPKTPPSPEMPKSKSPSSSTTTAALPPPKAGASPRASWTSPSLWKRGLGRLWGPP